MRADQLGMFDDVDARLGGPAGRGGPGVAARFGRWAAGSNRRMTTETPAAVVTGSDSGIGRACAVALARNGFDVGITYSSDEEGAKATADEVREIGRHAHVAHLDLTDLPAAGDVIDGLVHDLGRIDVLVNSAGTGSASLFVETDYEKLREARSTTDGGRCGRSSG